MFILGRKVSCGLRISHDPDLRSLDLHWTNEGHQLIIISMLYQKRACGGCVERIMNDVVVAKALSTSNKLIDHPFQSCFIKRGLQVQISIVIDLSQQTGVIDFINVSSINSICVKCMNFLCESSILNSEDLTAPKRCISKTLLCNIVYNST